MTDIIGCLAWDLARGRIEPPGGTICAVGGGSSSTASAPWEWAR
jgi:hypothetical protein